jgi:hypothetical protein
MYSHSLQAHFVQATHTEHVRRRRGLLRRGR